jgi:hypothetical protein
LHLVASLQHLRIWLCIHAKTKLLDVAAHGLI